MKLSKKRLIRDPLIAIVLLAFVAQITGCATTKLYDESSPMWNDLTRNPEFDNIKVGFYNSRGIEYNPERFSKEERAVASLIKKDLKQYLSTVFGDDVGFNVEVENMHIKTGMYGELLFYVTLGAWVFTYIAGMPDEYADFDATLSLKITNGEGKTLEPYRSESKITKYSNTFYYKASFEEGKIDAYKAALEGLKSKVLNDRRNIIAALGKSTAVAYVPKPETKKAPPVNIHDIPDFKVSGREHDMAVIIGIENYEDLPKAEFSKSDAGIMKDYLKALGFQDRNIEFITDGKATFSRIKKEFENWLPNHVKRDSTVFVYYSGHGAPNPKTGDGYLVPFDGDPTDLEDTGYSLRKLADNLGKLEAKQVIVLLDSCFSGRAGGRSVLAKGARPIVISNEGIVLKDNMMMLSATQGDQISTSSPDKGHGVFTYHFLKALKDGKTDLAEIYSYIKPQIEDEAKTLNVEQSPAINPPLESLKGRFSLRR